MSEQKEARRFEIQIPFKIEEIVDGERIPFFDCLLEYHDMPYDGIIAVQAEMIKLLKGLNGLGIIAAENMGLGKKLEVLGLKKD